MIRIIPISTACIIAGALILFFTVVIITKTPDTCIITDVIPFNYSNICNVTFVEGYIIGSCNYLVGAPYECILGKQPTLSQDAIHNILFLRYTIMIAASSIVTAFFIICTLILGMRVWSCSRQGYYDISTTL